jgi:hypothetical protein
VEEEQGFRELWEEEEEKEGFRELPHRRCHLKIDFFL